MPYEKAKKPRLYSTLLYSTLLYSTLLLVLTGCPSSTGGGDGGSGNGNASSTYSGYPSYNDDYTFTGDNIASWSNRKKWNLANVHDPSVAQWTDGYYYMYQTDASFGNAHDTTTSSASAATGATCDENGNIVYHTDSKGHFFCRRSKDLINWEWVGPSMNASLTKTVKTWILARLNAYRAEMGVDEGTTSLTMKDINWAFWAPCVKKITVGGVTKFRMYYSIVVDNYIKTAKINYEVNKTLPNFDNSWTERAFIGVMETTDPASNNWKDLGFVVCSSTDKGATNWTRSSSSDYSSTHFYYNAIDPAYYVDASDNHWLIYGSWHCGFACVQINPETGKVLDTTTNGDKTMGNPWGSSADDLSTNGYGSRIYKRGSSSDTSNRWQGSEGPDVIYRAGYYYMFFANDGLDIPYHTRVIRSTSPNSDYKDICGRSAINSGSGTGVCLPVITHPYKFGDDHGWVGISHCTVFDDGNDNWFYCSQGRLPAGTNDNTWANANMMGHVRRIIWCPANKNSTDNLWPIVSPERYGGVTQSAIKASDVAGSWLNINLDYNAGVQDTSTDLTLTLTDYDSSTGNGSGTCSGSFSGTWSFDSTTNYLTITDSSLTNRGVILVVQRELDWEASPRKATLVYAGVNASSSSSYTCTTYWGKQTTSLGAINYKEKFSSATLQATYTMTVADDAKDDLAWYLYPQWGTWTYVVDEGDGNESDAASVSGVAEWWAGTDTNKSARYSVQNGKTLTFYVTTTDTGCTMILEAYSAAYAASHSDIENPGFADINYHDTDNGWGTAISAWGTSDSRTAISANAAQSVKITITRSGTSQILKIYKL